MKKTGLWVIAGFILILGMVWYRNARDGDSKLLEQEREMGAMAAKAGASSVTAGDPAPEGRPGSGFLEPPGYRSLQVLKRGTDIASGSALTGYILSENEVPISDAEVTFYARRDPLTFEMSIPLVATRSRSDGGYTLAVEAPVEGWVQVRKEGFAPNESQLSLESSGVAERNFTLVHASTGLSGTVVDALEETSVADALVLLRLRVPGQQLQLERSTYSDALGRFYFVDLPAGRVDLTAGARGYIEDVQSLTLEGEGRDKIQLRIVRTDFIAFEVTDSAGNPITEAYVERPDSLIARTDHQGCVEFPVVVLKPFSCKIWADGFLVEKVTIDPNSPPARITLQEGKTVRGRVLSMDGRPISEARITAWSREVLHNTYEGDCKSDESGQFTLRLSQNNLARIYARRPGYVHSDLNFESGENPDFVEIRMQEAQSAVAGRVLRRNGQPVRRFGITLRRAGGEPGEMAFSANFDQIDGRFLIEDLAAGEFDLGVDISSPDDRSDTVVEGVQVLPGRVTDITIRLDPKRSRQ